MLPAIAKYISGKIQVLNKLKLMFTDYAYLVTYKANQLV